MTFAILHEPASYTVDRNRAVYDKLGVRYAYMHGESEAMSGESANEKPLSELSFCALYKRLKQILRENDTVIMNGYNGKIFLPLFFLNYFYRRRIGLDSDTQLVIPTNPVKRTLKSLYLHWIFTNRHIYGLAGGTQTHKELFRHYGMPESRIFLMPMMVNNAKFQCPTTREEKPFRFLYVGRIVDCKNIEMMIEAFVKAFPSADDVELQIVGRGDLLDELRERYAAHPHIKFAGPKYADELIAEYHHAHAFVLPSSFEPWGLVVNEAMAAGMPVLASSEVGARYDLVIENETGFVFAPDDIEGLSEKMKTLANDTELYKKMARNAAHKLNNEWNYEFYEKCLKKFLEK